MEAEPVMRRAMAAPRLVLAPAAGGKTRRAIERIGALLAAAPLSSVWVVVPDRNQGLAFQRRLAAPGALGVRVGTFGDLYAEVLAQAGQHFPVTPEPVIHRLLRTAIDRVAGRGGLSYYGPIQRRPGLAVVLAALFAELKRARITPQRFSAVTRGRGPRLEEPAALYEEYHAALARLRWSDHEGLGWLAVSALDGGEVEAGGFALLVVDGFDSFNPTQVALLKALAPRVGEMLITLTGEPEMSRLAYRRFGRTLATLREHLAPEIEVLPARAKPVAALAHLEAGLFRSDAKCLPAGRNVGFLEAQNVALEAREALRWLKARIKRDGVGADECAVLAKDIGAYRTYLREAAREFGLPLRLSCGEPLAANPAVAAVLSLLELPLQNWAQRTLLAAVRTPYFDLSPLGLAARDAARLDAVARAGRVVEGIEQWREALVLAEREAEVEADDGDEEEARPPRRPVGEAARALWECLGRLIRRLTPPAAGTVTEHAQWVEELLDERRGLKLSSRVEAQADTSRRDKAAVQALAGALAAMVLGEAVAGTPARMSYEEFYAELRAVIDGATYRLEEETHGTEQIHATDLAAARGVCYRAVAILGLSEGLFPVPLLEDPLLSEEEREECRGAGLPLEPRLRSDQQTLFYEGVTRATEYLLLTRPYLADDGELWEASPYWWAALRLFDAPVRRVRPEDIRPPADAASPAELLAWCVRRRSLPSRAYETLVEEWKELGQRARVLRARLEAKAGGAHEGELAGLRSALAGRYGPPHIWSASRLETYGDCPFHFFTSVALGLEERKPPEPGFDPAQLGLMLHEILERVYGECADATSVDALLAALPGIAGPVFDAAPRKLGFRPTPLWETQREEYLRVLERTLRALAAQAGSFRPAGFELGFGLKDGGPPLTVETDEGPVHFRGIIDRVDQDAAGKVRVIDYKTGSSMLEPKDLVEGRRLQLAIYALAAEQSLGLGSPVDGFYWAILKGEMGPLRLERFRYEGPDGREYAGARGAIELAVEHVGSFVRGIREGAFVPVARQDGCKSYCPARLFCWRYEGARW